MKTGGIVIPIVCLAITLYALYEVRSYKPLYLHKHGRVLGRDSIVTGIYLEYRRSDNELDIARLDTLKQIGRDKEERIGGKMWARKTQIGEWR